MRLSLLERKARLEPLLSGALALIHFSSHVVGNGAQVSESGAKLGVEGMVSKQIGKPYLPGNRGVWVKTKFFNRQDSSSSAGPIRKVRARRSARCCSAITPTTAI
jgi:ATP-dependent DNA ligase